MNGIKFMDLNKKNQLGYYVFAGYFYSNEDHIRDTFICRIEYRNKIKDRIAYSHVVDVYSCKIIEKVYSNTTKYLNYGAGDKIVADSKLNLVEDFESAKRLLMLMSFYNEVVGPDEDESVFK